MSRLKICGMTNLQDVVFCDQPRVDFQGFIFYPGSKRYIKPLEAKPLIAKLQHSKAVGVFVGESTKNIIEIATDLNLWGVQVYEAHDFGAQPFKVIRALQVEKAVHLPPNSESDPESDYVLLDTPHPNLKGGTGKAFDWTLLPQDLSRVFLAGGINCHTIEAALAYAPFAVDLVSGVEAFPGKKDWAKVTEMISFFRE